VLKEELYNPGTMHRRQFLSLVAAAALPKTQTKLLYSISLAEWSFHRALRAGDMEHLDFAAVAQKDYGLDAIEYVNTFFFDKARDTGYLNDMKSRADGEGVQSLLIMCDNEGDLGDDDGAARDTAVRNHHKWVEAAKTLGCHSIRVNARSNPELDFEEQQKLAADGLRRLCELAEPYAIDVIVENHGGLSSNGAWLQAVMKRVDHPRVGTLPDFGNFKIRSDPEEWYDRYQGVRELMPYAKAVSAKSHDFDTSGNETGTDYDRMLRIVLDAGYRGYVGIEYEGEGLSEQEGVHATRDLLVRVREELTAAY
jgi:sugar phosphate isomerase/epimerase